MSDPRGFLKLSRKKERERPAAERIQDWREVTIPSAIEDVREQASRCMDCGVPFCHQGCPLGNLVPEWNELTMEGQLDEAVVRLARTNNFPEITGRVCPAPCEASCVLNLEGTPVTIKRVERALADHEFSRDLVPVVAETRTGKRIAIIGSGPAGLAAAQQLAREGHDVTVFERDDRIGGLLRYGIPDFKLERVVLDRRLDQMRAEGVAFVTSKAPTKADLSGFDASILAMGARAPRELSVPGRAFDGVHFAMPFLEQQNRRVAGDTVPGDSAILATGKRVVVIGGGDTGADCVGTCIRQGAANVLQLEIMPRPNDSRLPGNPWPEWPLILRSSTSHDEGANRDWAVMTVSLKGDQAANQITALQAVRVTFEGGAIKQEAGSEHEIPCDLVLLAMGFVGPEREGIVHELGLALDARGNVKSDAEGRTNIERIFAAGDVSRGQSLVVWAIADGRRVAKGVSRALRERAAS